jgi:hypothetical protein
MYIRSLKKTAAVLNATRCLKSFVAEALPFSFDPRKAQLCLFVLPLFILGCVCLLLSAALSSCLRVQ